MVTVAAATVPMPGQPVDDSSLGKEHVQIWKKATGGGSAIPLGRVVVIVPGAQVCAQAVAGSYGRFGVVARLDDNYDAVTGRGDMNTDTSDQVVVLTDGARVYVQATNAGIKFNSEVQAGSTGLIAQYVESPYSGATAALYYSGLRDVSRVVGIYECHYGESLQAGGEPPTDATANQANLVLRVSGRYSQ